MRRPHKGFDIYLRACAVVAGRDRKAHFLLVGDEAHAEAGHEAHLRNLQNDPRLKGRLHVLPSQPELAAWLKSLAVFVLSSRWEGSPLVLLEAMALGVPVVVTAEGAGEIVEDGKDGLLVDAGDAPGMAAGILRLLKDRALARRLGRAAKAKVSRHFSLRKYVRDLMGIYDEVLGPRGSAASASSPQRQDSTGL
jgi:glycosyltransferase involved in cell wall biosynthesis